MEDLGDVVPQCAVEGFPRAAANATMQATGLRLCAIALDPPRPASLGSARVRLPSLLVRLCRSFEMPCSPPCSPSFALFGEPSAVQAAQ